MPENPSNNQPTILVVDDEEDIRELFTLFLKRLHYKTVTAENGDEAIALYQQSLDDGKIIDAIILDINIPNSIGGTELAQKIHTIDPKAKIIVSSGHSESPEMTHYQDYGFQGAIEKDFNAKKIKQVLEQVLAKN